MKKKALTAAAFAAVILTAVILGIAIWKDHDGEMISQSAEVQEISEQEVTDSTDTQEAIPTPVFTKETEITSENEKSPKMGQSNEAFNLKIQGRSISVAYGVDENVIARTPGWLTTSARPGEGGLCVVYGHRNRTHLKVLAKVSNGDIITVTMPDGTTHTYTVTDIRIYENTSDWCLPLIDGKGLALVTCYPFHYAGNAPGKYLVLAKSI